MWVKSAYVEKQPTRVRLVPRLTAVYSVSPWRLNKTFYLETFGCQMNVHDSEKVIGTLRHEGYAQVIRNLPPT